MQTLCNIMLNDLAKALRFLGIIKHPITKISGAVVSEDLIVVLECKVQLL